MTPKKKIQFTDDVEVVSQGIVEFSAKAGDVVETNYASASHWLRRNKAVDYVESKVKKEVETSAEPEAKPAPAKKSTRRRTAKTKADLER